MFESTKQGSKNVVELKGKSKNNLTAVTCNFAIPYNRRNFKTKKSYTTLTINNHRFSPSHEALKDKSDS